MSAQIDRLRRLPRETEWVEFKQNQADPEGIGKYLSSLANSAALADQPIGYVVWGIEDGSHAIVGTTFDPFSVHVGNEILEGWLNRLVEPRIAFSFGSGHGVGEACENAGSAARVGATGSV